MNMRCISRKQGQSLVELVSVYAVLLPVVLVLIDLGVVAVGYALNDAICRDAVRAAASGPPGLATFSQSRQVADGEAPKQRAMAVIKRLYRTDLPMRVRDDVKVLETVRDVPPSEVGGAVDGEMTVETIMDVYPPFLVRAIMDSRVSVKTRHSVPITYVTQPQQ